MRLTVPFILLFGAFFFSSAAAQTTFVSQDVLTEAKSLGIKGANAYCPANPNYWRGSLGAILKKRPPDRLLGLNSRMDNAESLRAHVVLDDATNVISAAASHILLTGNSRVADQLLDVLTLWARSGAYINTKTCTQNGRWTGKCTEWTRSDGQDLSDTKDHSTTVMAIASIASAYRGAVANYKTQQRASDHQAIQKWLKTFHSRIAAPKKVFLGLKAGKYWPAIEAAYAQGNTRKAKSLTSKLVKGLDRLILKDGSIKDRTTRGDRALWYHATAIGEIVTAMEMARTQGVKLPSNMEAKLHKSVILYVNAVRNPATIDPWAKVAHNSTYRPNYQNYRKDFWQNFFGHAWLHIYVYRYPDEQAAKWLATRIPRRSQSALFDADTGIATGCIFNAARAARNR